MVWVYLHSFFSGLHKTHLYCKNAYRRFKAFKVIDFCTNRKSVGDFLLVRHSNLGPYLAPFQRYCTFSALHPYSTLSLWVFPLDQIVDVAIFQRCDLVRHFPGPTFSRSCIFNRPAAGSLTRRDGLHLTLKDNLQKLNACPHCRRKVRQSPNFADVSPFSATVSLFCDSVDRALLELEKLTRVAAWPFGPTGLFGPVSNTFTFYSWHQFTQMTKAYIAEKRKTKEVQCYDPDQTTLSFQKRRAHMSPYQAGTSNE